MKANVLLVAGVSGAGKSYLETELVRTGFVKCITMTSREPRVGEVDGVDYHFRPSSHFEEMLSLGDMIEHNYGHGAHYGMSQQMFSDSASRACGSPLYIILDPIGVAAYQKALGGDYNVRTVFLDCPISLREQRILSRLSLDSTQKELKETAKRLVQTRSFESNWRDSTTHDIYVPISESQVDCENIVLSALRSFDNGKVEYTPAFIRSGSPVSFVAPECEVEAEIGKICGYLREKNK